MWVLLHQILITNNVDTFQGRHFNAGIDLIPFAATLLLIFKDGSFFLQVWLVCPIILWITPGIIVKELAKIVTKKSFTGVLFTAQNHAITWEGMCNCFMNILIIASDKPSEQPGWKTLRTLTSLA